MSLSKEQRRARIKRRVRGKISGTGSVPRLSVFRSNKDIYAQIIDDAAGVTLVAESSRSLSSDESISKVEQAKEVGKLLGSKAASVGVSTVVFDRNGYLYHGRVKSLAEGAREAGLKF